MENLLLRKLTRPFASKLVVDRPAACPLLSAGGFQTRSAGGHVTILRLGSRVRSIDDLVPLDVLAVGLQTLSIPSEFKTINLIPKLNLNV